MKTIMGRYYNELYPALRDEKVLKHIVSKDFAEAVLKGEKTLTFSKINEIENIMGFNFTLKRAILEINKLMLDKGVNHTACLEKGLTSLKPVAFNFMMNGKNGKLKNLEELEDNLRKLPDIC